MVSLLCYFCFKQKTAYEMRISDWSSDVCSSDLMSHELRTPLNAVIGFSEMMNSEIFGPLLPRYKDYAGDILHSARHLLSVIDNIQIGRASCRERVCQFV